MWSLVLRAASDRTDEVLLADDHGRTLTASDLHGEADRVAAGLAAQGVGAGDVVSWQLPSVLELPVLMAALSRLGAIQNPIIPLLREREVSVIAEQVSPRLFICPTEWRAFSHAGMARSFGLDVLALDLEAPPGPSDPLRLPTGDPAQLPPHHDDPDECRWIFYSSGTTSIPKGVRHSDASIAAGSNGVVHQLGLGSGDIYPIAWPLSHIGGSAMFGAVLRNGGTICTVDTFDPATTPQRMAELGATMLGSATPFFLAYTAAQRAKGADPLFPRLRTVVSGGAPTPSEVNREVVEVLGVAGVAGAWGLTEFPVATSETPDDPWVGTTAGRPVTDVEVRVVDGELRLRGPQCFLGYVDSSLDADAFDADGWFRTGDLGHLDQDGCIHVDGRIKDVIIRNAENISAQEVEEVLLRHPGVADVAVVGIPDPRTGERVAAVVVPAADQPADSTADPTADPTVDLATLVAHCAESGLSRYKHPEHLQLVDDLPRNSMGKVLKADLRKQLAAEV